MVLFKTRDVLMRRINYSQGENPAMQKKAIAVLPVVLILAVIAIASVGTFAAVSSGSSSVTSGVVTLMGQSNTLPQYIQPLCPKNPIPNEPELCLPSETNTVTLGSLTYLGSGYTFSSSFEVNQQLDHKLVLVASNSTVIVKLIVQISTWNTTATISPLDGIMSITNKSGAYSVPFAAAIQGVTYFVPSYTITNATFDVGFNRVILHQGPNEVYFTFKVTDALNRAKTMGINPQEVYLEG